MFYFFLPVRAARMFHSPDVQDLYAALTETDQ